MRPDAEGGWLVRSRLRAWVAAGIGAGTRPVVVVRARRVCAAPAHRSREGVVRHEVVPLPRSVAIARGRHVDVGSAGRAGHGQSPEHRLPLPSWSVLLVHGAGAASAAVVCPAALARNPVVRGRDGHAVPASDAPRRRSRSSRRDARVRVHALRARVLLPAERAPRAVGRAPVVRRLRGAGATDARLALSGTPRADGATRRVGERVVARVRTRRAGRVRDLRGARHARNRLAPSAIGGFPDRRAHVADVVVVVVGPVDRGALRAQRLALHRAGLGRFVDCVPGRDLARARLLALLRTRFGELLEQRVVQPHPERRGDPGEPAQRTGSLATGGHARVHLRSDRVPRVEGVQADRHARHQAQS